ncbi:hypothetical protein F5887DRAFT_1233630 [Amanita rubescens]|nr:hypothetical protein F5887DRAFT_1233630 [Amanita rubescens]
MASQAPGQSRRLAYELGPLSLEGGASDFKVGEYVLVRIPEGIQVYPVLASGAVLAYNELTDAGKETLLPLPNLSFRHPTPDAFGIQLNFGNWSTFRDSFLHVIPRWFVMPAGRPFKRMIPPLIMPAPVLLRIDHYREYLRSNTQTTNTHNYDDQSHSLPMGSGDEQGSSDTRHGQTTDKVMGELEQFSVKSPHGLLVLEGVDEDAEGADATMLDQLIMLAHDDPIWKEELRRYLQREEEEREQMQKERGERLARWRDNIAVQPT